MVVTAGCLQSPQITSKIGKTQHRNNLSEEQIMLIVDMKILLVNSPYILMYPIDLCYLSYAYSCVNNM